MKTAFFCFYKFLMKASKSLFYLIFLYNLFFYYLNFFKN